MLDSKGNKLTETYLSNLISSLPENCLFDKGKVGCGGTSLALESKEPYIVCVPFISLIENKLSQYPNSRRKEKVFGVSGNTRIKDIKKYLRKTKIPKILVTYDSLWKVANAVNTKLFRLLVDEYHLLFNQYSFRADAVKVVLDNYQKFKSFTFLTATPLESEFILEELKHLPLVVQEWTDVVNVRVNTVKCTNVEASTIKLIRAFINNIEEGNAYIFVNSVEFIKSIITKTEEITEANTRVIYSQNNRTEVGLPNSTVNSIPKKINFLTSTVFEGSDIYDEVGRTFIISDPSKAQTLLDISTSVQQIAGRIRNTKYNDTIIHLYKNTRYSELSYEEFKKFNEDTIVDSKEFLEELNKVSEKFRDKIKDCVSDTYINYNKGIFYFDPNKVKVDIYNYKVAKGIYSVRANLSNSYTKLGFEVKTSTESTLKIEVESTKSTFKDIVKNIRTEGSTIIRSAKIKDALIKYPFISEAIEKLGFERIATLDYSISKVKDELLKLSNKSDSQKIAFKLNKLFHSGDFYSNDQIKNIISEVNNLFEENLKPSDLNNYFILKPSLKKINKDTKRGYIVAGKKYIY